VDKRIGYGVVLGIGENTSYMDGMDEEWIKG
jgi:hypothetical protein